MLEPSPHNFYAMKWEKAVTSDDTARQGDSLVASILRGESSISKPHPLVGTYGWAMGATEADIKRGLVAVLRVDAVAGNYRIFGTTSCGMPFRTTVGIWRKDCIPATEADWDRAQSQATPSDLQIGSSEPTAEESSADQPGWMKAAIKRIAWRQRLRMNLPLNWDPDRFPDL